MKIASLFLSFTIFVLGQLGVYAQPFTTSSNSVNLALAPGFNHTSVPIGITPVGSGFDFSNLQVSSDSAWVTPSVDSASSTVLLTFATSSLTAASYTATITATHGSDSQTIMVGATGAALSVFKLIDDPFRSRVYGLSQQALNRGSVIVIDPVSGALLSNVTVGRKPTGLAVSNDGSELFVINTVDEAISVVDLNTLRLKETINIASAFDNWGQSDTTANIGTGPGDIIYYTDGAWAPALRVYKRSTSAVLQTVFVDGSSGNGIGDFGLNSTKTALFAWAQYGWSAGWAGSYVSKFTVSATGTLTVAQTTSSAYPTPLSRDPLETPVLVPHDDQSVFVKKWMANAGAITSLNRTFSSDIYSISPGGEIAATSSSIIETATGNLLYSLPVSTTVQTITSDYARLVLFNGTTRTFQFIDLFATVGAAAMGRSLSPASGSVVLAPSALQWSPVAGADLYRVYLGTSSSSVAAAGTGSPEYLGQTASPTMAITSSLTPGTTYYWRVDSVSSASGVSTGAIYSFTVSVLSLSPAVITTGTVQGHSDLTQTLSLDAITPGTAWEATSDKPWVTFVSATGITPATLTIKLNASTLPAGTNTATITLSNGTGVLGTVPVTLSVDALKLTQIKSDPSSKFVYAISEDSAAASPKAYLLEIDSVTEQITRVLQVGSSVTDLALHNADGRIYVPNWMPGALRAIDKTTFTLARTYAFNPYQGTGYGQGDVYRVAAGGAGRLVIEEQDQWIDINIFNTTSGSSIATTFQRQGGGAFDPTGRYYYHGDDNISNAEVRKFDTTGDVFTALSHIRVSSNNYYGSRVVVVSESGNAVFWNGSHFNADLVEQWSMAKEVYSTTPDGRYAFGETQIFDTVGKQQVLGMPATTRVSAFNSTSSKFMAQVGQKIAFFPMASPLSLPAPVLSAGTPTYNSVPLVWQDRSLEMGFTLQYRIQGAASWTNGTAPLQNATSATVSSLAENTTYEFRVKADAAAISSDWSNVLIVTTPISPPTAPFLYTPSASASRVTLTWTDSNKEDSFVLERRLSGSATWTVVANIAANVVTYADSTVTPETSYEYRIKAMLGSLASAYSSIVYATTPAPQPPVTPTGVTLRVVSGTQLRITWGNVADETGYLVERRTDDPLSWVQVGTVGADEVLFNDLTVEAGLQYWYRIKSFNAVGSSSGSSEVTGTPVDLACIAQDDFDPGYDAGVWASVTSGTAFNGGTGFLGSNALWFGSTGTRAATTVPLNLTQVGYLDFKFRAGNQTVDGITYWNNSETGETVVMEYSLDGVTWVSFVSLNTVYPNLSSWTPHFVQVPQAAISSATRFRWRQLANSGGTNDTWAIEDLCVFSGLPPAPPAPPFIITSPNSASSVAVSWAAALGAASYLVERTIDGSNWTQVASVPGNQTFFTDTGLNPASWYQYRIKAANAGGASPPSATSLVATLSRIAQWRLENYGTTTPTGQASSDSAGHDGIKNLAKYAFNMDNSDGVSYVLPGSGTKGLPTTHVNSATRKLRIEFIRRKASSDPGVTYTAEFASDLNSFAPAGGVIQVTPINDLLERVVWEDGVSLDEAPVRFSRVKVTETP